MSCFGGWLAGKRHRRLGVEGSAHFDPGLLYDGRVTRGRGAARGCRAVDGCDEELDAAEGEWELDEQALSEMTAASSEASSVGPTRNRARATLPIDSIPSSARQLDPA